MLKPDQANATRPWSASKAKARRASGRRPGPLSIVAATAADVMTNLPFRLTVLRLETQLAEVQAGIARLEAAGVTSGPAIETARARNVRAVTRELDDARQGSVEKCEASAAALVQWHVGATRAPGVRSSGSPHWRPRLSLRALP